MTLKREIPAWSVIAAIVLVLVLVAGFFIRNGGGDASKDELDQIRSNQRRFSSPSAPPPTQTNIR